MRLGRMIIMLVLLIVAVAIFFPDTFSAGKDWVSEKISGTEVELTTPSNNTYSAGYQQDIYVEGNETEIVVDNGTSEEDFSETGGFDPEDPSVPLTCLKPNKEFPDYEGTNKEGDTCADVLTNNDYECLSNPPTSYDGQINTLTKTSTPELGCCLLDGKCHWN